MFDNFFERFHRIFIEKNGFALLMEGLEATLLIALAALVIGIVLGTILATIKVMPKRNFLMKMLHAFADVYITVFRGVPIVVLLLLCYFALLGPLGMDGLFVAFIVFGINSSAYVAEIIRSGILAVDHGQMEAGRSLGLSYGATMIKIILPQAIKNILPALGNELIVLLKETSVAGFVAVNDITRQARSIVSSTYDVLVPYLMLALIYLVLVVICTFLVNRFERWLRRSDHR